LDNQERSLKIGHTRRASSDTVRASMNKKDRDKKSERIITAAGFHAVNCPCDDCGKLKKGERVPETRNSEELYWQACWQKQRDETNKARKQRDELDNENERLRERVNEMATQRDELLAALKQIKAALTQEVQWYSGDSRSLKIIQGDCAVARDTAAAAIAKAEKGAGQ
jgi:DNA repair exonuclease SbcCD ATPase subunit